MTIERSIKILKINRTPSFFLCRYSSTVLVYPKICTIRGSPVDVRREIVMYLRDGDDDGGGDD